MLLPKREKYRKQYRRPASSDRVNEQTKQEDSTTMNTLSLDDIIKAREEAVELKDKIIKELQEEISETTNKVFEIIIDDLKKQARIEIDTPQVGELYDLYLVEYIMANPKFGADATLSTKDKTIFENTSSIFFNLSPIKQCELSGQEIRDLFEIYDYLKGLYTIIIEHKLSIVDIPKLIEKFTLSNIEAQVDKIDRTNQFKYELNVSAIIPTKDEIHKRTLKK